MFTRLSTLILPAAFVVAFLSAGAWLGQTTMAHQRFEAVELAHDSGPILQAPAGAHAQTSAASQAEVAVTTALGCEPLTCHLECEYGYILDENGCPICECFRPASTPPAVDDKPTPEPSTKCGDVLCDLYCEYGFAVGESGCPICQCADNG